MRKPILALALALSVFAVTGAGAALAHECFNANRSARGNEGADHSPVWETLTLEFLAADVGLNEEQTEQFLELAAVAGIPEGFTIFVGNHTIGQNSPAYTEGGKATDGKAIDWFFTAYGEDLIGIICVEVDPSNPICFEGPPE